MDKANTPTFQESSIRSSNDIESIKARARKARTRALVLRAAPEPSQVERSAVDNGLVQGDDADIGIASTETSAPGAVACTSEEDMKVEKKNHWIDPMTESTTIMTDITSSNSHGKKDPYAEYSQNPGFYRHSDKNNCIEKGKKGASTKSSPDDENVVNAPAMHLSVWKSQSEAMSVKSKVHLNRNLCIAGVLVFIGVIVGVGVAIGLTVGGGKEKEGDTNLDRSPVLPPTVAPAIVSTECLDGSLENPSERLEKLSEILGSPAFDTPQRKSLCWLADSDELQVDPIETDIAAQRYSLAVFYFSTTVDDLEGLASSNWLSAQNECEWLGVTCENDKVQGLNLEGQSLVGTIASELALLSELSTLVLNNNELTGMLPEEIYGMSNLAILALEQNALVGSLSSQIGSLQQMEILSIGTNKLTGTLPLELFDITGLVSLLSYGSGLTGSIPTAIGGLSLLRIWAADENSLTGSIPTEIGLCTALEQLGLGGNGGMNSTIPTEIGLLTNLAAFSVDNAKVRGSIPSELGNCLSLQQLLLSNNPDLEGEIPVEIGNLKALKELQLQVTRLTGTMPAEICLLRDLELGRLLSDCKRDIECICCTDCW